MDSLEHAGNTDQSSFQSGRSHILLVAEKPGSDQGALGIVTLEDVVEVRRKLSLMFLDADMQELIGREIIVSPSFCTAISADFLRMNRTNMSIYIGESSSCSPCPSLTISRVPVIRSTKDSTRSPGLKRIVEKRLARRRVINTRMTEDGAHEVERLIDHPSPGEP
jgi:metal transporter CNNM